MTNIKLPSIEMYEDVATIHTYHSFHKHEPKEKRMQRIYRASRDSARTPMQWSGAEHAGFSVVKPWFYVNPNYPTVNVEREEEDPQSILNTYRRCLALRKSSRTLLFGSYREYDRRNRNLYVYERRLDRERYLIVCSFSEEEQEFRFPKGFDSEGAELVLCNYPEAKADGVLRPYEARVLRWREV